MKKIKTTIAYFAILIFIAVFSVAKAESFDPEAISQVSKGIAEWKLMNEDKEQTQPEQTVYVSSSLSGMVERGSGEGIGVVTGLAAFDNDDHWIRSEIRNWELNTGIEASNRYISRLPANPYPHFKDDKTEKRVEYLQDRLRINPNDVESHMELGKIFLKEDFNEEAINEFEQVLNVDSNYIHAYLLLSLALQKRPKPDLLRVAGLLETATQIAPDNADVHLNLAQVYDKLKKEEEAIAEFKKAIELSNDPAILVSAHLGLMAIYKKQGDSLKAKEEYEAAYKIYPAVEEMIKQAEINHITPPPRYAGEGFREDDGLHPSYEERIKRLREEIRKILGGEK
ncbi:MAG: tetratricopeptide repeat protein [Candidatus Omnitrophica bacterium]|nr:tetratricopeptide repeat protein [Candidatus Omnitrophota bacterium]